MTTVIRISYRIVIAISKHVIAQQSLAGGNKRVGIDESTNLGVVITALEVIQPRLLVMALAKRPIFDLAGIATRLPQQVADSMVALLLIPS